MKRPFAVVAALVLAGCSAPAATTDTNPDTKTAQTRTLTVFAAASLTGAFTDLATGFEADHPGTQVRFTFDGSSSLVDQLAGGAKADLFASADEKNMQRAVEAKTVTGEPKIFATNTLTLVTEPNNPAKITGLNGSLDGKKLVVCATGVPCGNATDQLAKNLGVTLKPVSEEQKVTDVLGKVTSGEADAGVVYRTDAKTAGDKVTTVPIAGADTVINRYPIATVASTNEAALANDFVGYVTSAKGQAILNQFDFGKP